MQEPPKAIYLVTGVNQAYLPRAEAYLASIQRNSNVHNVVVTLDFEVPRRYRESYPALRFVSISSSQIRSPNVNSCMQHGAFLAALGFVRETDIVIYTDADIELQRPLTDKELAWLRGFTDGDIGVGYNESKEEYLSVEALRLEPTVGPEELARRYPGLDRSVTYNTGVLAANARTYGKLYGLYDQHWPDFAPLFRHYAKQQWLLSYLVHTSFRPQSLPSTFHTHGHHPVALRVTGDAGHKFCIGSDVVLLSHALGQESKPLERQIRLLQRRVCRWIAFSIVLAVICLLLLWRWLA